MGVSTTKSVKKAAETPDRESNWPAEWGELEKVFVPIDDGDETPIEGCLNGRNWIVYRNVWTDVPTAIKAILEQTRTVLVESEKRNKKFEEGKLNLS